MKRLQFELSDKRVEEMDTLAERTGLKTRVQLINAALTLFEWAVRERESGRIIASVDEYRDRYKEIEMPGFPSIEHEGSIEAILSQLEQHLKTPEQEEAFATLSNVLNKDLLGKNTNHPERSTVDRPSGIGDNLKNTAEIKPE